MWLFGKKKTSKPKQIRAKYDAAQTTVDNMRHWAMADAYSADAAMTPEVRRTLRNRSRYEVANNSYAKGMVLTIAGDCVGTGPRLQLLTERDEYNSRIEQEFADWCETIDLPQKLRAMRMAKATDGEAFAILVKNPHLQHPVKLDIRLVEADRIATPEMQASFENLTDGIEFDAYGNPLQYYLLKYHPGDGSFRPGEFEKVPVEAMIHWYRMDRPGQHRGIPETTPALPLFAQLRRYTLAVLAAAETAADFAAVLYTDSPANGEAQSLEPMDVVPLEKRMATVLADGWKLGQIKAEHPNTTYAEFKREILGEIGRCLLVPVNVLTGDSSQHNYASGRLDHQTYFRSLRIEQSHCAKVVLDKIFNSWMALRHSRNVSLFPHSAKRNPSHQNGIITEFGSRPTEGGAISAEGNRDATSARCWYWDGMEHVDPLKEANAQAKRLGSLTTNLAAEYARQGKDWEMELRQAARERELMKQLGLAPSPEPTNSNQDETDEENDNELMVRSKRYHDPAQ